MRESNRVTMAKLSRLKNNRNQIEPRLGLFIVVLLALASLLAGCDLFSAIIGGSPRATAKIIIGSVEVPAGGTVKVKVAVDIPSGARLAEIQVGPGQALRFDPEVIQIKGITGIGGFTVLASAIENTIGEARFAAVSIYGGVAGGEILEIEVEAIGKAGEESELKLTGVDLLQDETGKGLGPVAIINGRVKIK